MVNKLLFKPVSAVSPVLLQVLGQEARHNHAATIRHKASSVHVPHESVDDWVTSGALLPSRDNIMVSFPRVVLSVVNSVFTENFVSVVHAPASLEVTPEQLVKINGGRLIAFVFGLEISSSEINLPTRNATILEPGRKLARVVGAD